MKIVIKDCGGILKECRGFEFQAKEHPKYPGHFRFLNSKGEPCVCSRWAVERIEED